MKSIIVLLVLLFARSALASPAIPVKEFARSPQFISAQISPKGDFLAVSLEVEGQRRLGILDARNKKILSLLQLAQEEHVWDYWWVSPTRVVVTIAKRWGPLDEARLTGELYAMDADGSNKYYLFGFRGDNTSAFVGGRAKQQWAWAEMADTLRSDEDNVLIAVRHWGDIEGTPTTLARLNVHNGKQSVLDVVPIPAGVDFVADSAGKPRYATGLDLKGNLVQMVKRGDAWQPVFESAEVHSIELLGMSGDDRSVFMLSDQSSPHVCLREYLLDRNEMTTLACSEDADVSRVEFSFDGSRPIAVYYGGSDTAAQYLDSGGTDAAFLQALQKAFPGQRLDITSRTDDGKLLLVHAWSDRVPGDFFLVNVATKKAEFLFSMWPGIDPEQMAGVRPIRYQTRDGATIHGYLTLPNGQEPRKLPLVMLPHGGPFGIADEWSWDPWAQLLASRGYAVLQVNYRGSGGYGFAHEAAGYQKTATLMQDDLTDAVRWAVGQQIADPERVCIFGASYGGYAALMSPEREPSLYRCAIAFAGVYDVEEQHDDADYSRSALASTMVRQRWGEKAEQLADASPINHLDRLSVPVLIAHGTADERVPFSQAKELRKALDKARKPYEWLEFKNEVHGFIKEENHEAFLAAVLAFLDKHIGPGSRLSDRTTASSAESPGAQ